MSVALRLMDEGIRHVVVVEGEPRRGYRVVARRVSSPGRGPSGLLVNRSACAPGPGRIVSTDGDGRTSTTPRPSGNGRSYPVTHRARSSSEAPQPLSDIGSDAALRGLLRPLAREVLHRRVG